MRLSALSDHDHAADDHLSATPDTAMVKYDRLSGVADMEIIIDNHLSTVSDILNLVQCTVCSGQHHPRQRTRDGDGDVPCLPGLPLGQLAALQVGDDRVGDAGVEIGFRRHGSGLSAVGTGMLFSTRSETGAQGEGMNRTICVARLLFPSHAEPRADA
jgi:hypothetical protein